MKVLLVDDDERILNSFSRWLRKLGYEVECSENGEEALEKVPRFMPDLVISDMRMTPIDGVTLMGKIPEGEGYYPGKIIFTAFDDGDALELGKVGEGGVFRVEKDRWEIDLVSTIRRAIELKKAKTEVWLSAMEIRKKDEEIKKMTFVKTVAATLGHEINNPLQTISLANSSLVANFGETADNEFIRDSVQRVKEISSSLIKLPKLEEINYARGHILKL